MIKMAQISQKELMYLEDFLSIEAQEVTKFQQASNNATDPQAKNLLKNIANMHQNHFDTLKSHLDSQSTH